MSLRAPAFLGSLGASLLLSPFVFAQASGGVSLGGGASTDGDASGAATGTATAPAAPAGDAAAPAPADASADAEAAPSDELDLGPRFLFGVHVGALAEISADEETESYGGALVGGSFFYGPLEWLSLGLAYERSFLGRDDESLAEGVNRRTSRGANALWLTGRLYPYENEDFAWFVDLAGAPVWQDISVSETIPPPDVVDSGTVLGRTCDAGDSAKLGLRGGTGIEFPLQSILIMHAQLGFDHYAFGEEEIDGCGTGGNPATFFAARVGFAVSTGRVLPADTDEDGIYDDVDACKEEKGVADPDPKKHGCPVLDKDGDTVLDPVDACPDVPGAVQADPAKNGCPLPGDADGDGIRDDVDACRTVPGVESADPAKNGCPPDKDGDGIVDAQDACPDQPGPANADPAKNGCPPPADTDGDGILDPQDACPTEPGKPDPDPAKNGCPLVVVKGDEIVIGEQVQFETNKAVIRPESNGLLDNVADVIKKNPQIKKLEVQGHTDNTGAKQHNKLLSQRRAEAVKKALEQRGIEPAKLTAKGYGQDQPIADNTTDAGRAKNRRVQFLITEKDKAAAPGAPPATPASKP